MNLMIAGTVLFLCSGVAHGQSLYKCRNANGTSAYQQTPCATVAQDAGRVRYQREADSPHWSAEEHDERQSREQQARNDQKANQRGVMQAARSGGNEPRRFSTDPASDDAEERRRFEHMAGSREGRAQLRAMNKLPPLPAARPSQQPQTNTYVDQRGGTYTQAPGGPIINNRTSRTCRQEGVNLICN